MGTFSVSIAIFDVTQARSEQLDAMVDTGATYTVVPAPVLDRLGIRRLERMPFVLADGRMGDSDVGEALIGIENRRRTSPVVFGEPGEPVLLGAVTLESLLLGVDPVARRLIPVPGLRY